MRFLVNVTTHIITVPYGEMQKHTYKTETMRFLPRKPIELDGEVETDVMENGKSAIDSGELVEVTPEKAGKMLEEWDKMKYSPRPQKFMNFADELVRAGARFAQTERMQEEQEQVYRPQRTYPVL